MKCEIFRRHEAQREFARVQRDVNSWIDAVQIVDHSHVLVKIVDGNVPIFGHHKIQTYEKRVRRSEFEAEQDLCEDCFMGQSAQHLVKIAYGHITSGGGVCGSTL